MFELSAYLKPGVDWGRESGEEVGMEDDAKEEKFHFETGESELQKSWVKNGDAETAALPTCLFSTRDFKPRPIFYTVEIIIDLAFTFSIFI